MAAEICMCNSELCRSWDSDSGFFFFLFLFFMPPMRSGSGGGGLGGGGPAVFLDVEVDCGQLEFGDIEIQGKRLSYC